MSKQQSMVTIPLVDDIELVLASFSAKKRLLKKYYRLAGELMAASENQKQFNLTQIFPNRVYVGIQTPEEKITTQINKLMRARSSCDLIKKSFDQVAFDMYRAKVINDPNKRSDMLSFAKVAEKLGIEYPTKNAALHKTKESKISEYAALRFYYLNKKEALTRDDVVRLIKLADFLKLPRNLSDLNLSKCDLTGLDLRKTKFNNATMDNIKIDQFTKFKGSTFDGVKMSEISINVPTLNGSPLTLKRESGALLRTFKNQYQFLRDKKIKSIQEKFGAFFKNKAASFISDYAKMALTENNGENALRFIEHAEKGGRSETALKNSLRSELVVPRPFFFASREIKPDGNATEEAKRENPDLLLLDF